MQIRQDFPYKPFLQLALLFVLALVTSVIFTYIGAGIAALFFGVEDISHFLSHQMDEQYSLSAILLLQGFSAIGLFLAPPLILSLILKEKPLSFLKVDAKPLLMPSLLVIGIMLTCYGIVTQAYYLNQMIGFPGFLENFKESILAAEKASEVAYDRITFYDSFPSLLLGILVIGVIAGIAEEVLFRGAIQPIVTKIFNNPHLGIWFTAVLFSAIHFQYFYFLPRLALGVTLGYLFYWSGNLWYSIFMHILNNSIILIVLFALGISDPNYAEDGAESTGFFTFLLVSLMFFYLLYRFKQTHKIEVDERRMD